MAFGVNSPVAQLAQTGNTTVQALTNAAAAVAEFDTGTGTPTNIAQDGSSVSAAASTITIGAAGVYLICCQVQITPPAQTHTVTLTIQKANTDIGGSAVAHKCVASTVFDLTSLLMVECVQGDVLRPAVVSSDAGPQNYTVGEAAFWAMRIG